MLAISAPAADLAPYSSVRPILEGLAPQLSSEIEWNRWAREQDQAIRARLERGDLDSMVNLLLFGTSFTTQPRIRIEEMAEAAKSGVLRARTLDLLAGVRTPGGNERLLFPWNLILAQGTDPDSAQAGVFVLSNVERVLKELREFADRPDRSRVFHDRGVSLDTSIFPNIGIEQALRELKARGLLHGGQVARAAVIGPGLDFTDWDAGYDYYPQQTFQPFALHDSLVRLGLAKDGAPRITVFDISARVLDHLRRAREQARTGQGYAIQLPRDATRRWTQAADGYWRAFGDRVGEAARPLRPPAALGSIKTRAVRIRPSAVLSCDPADLNLVVQREPRQFDLVIATNVLVYYDALEQALAFQNVASMLRPGGLFLVNTELPRSPGLPLEMVGRTWSQYLEGQDGAGDWIVWWRKPLE